MTEESRSRNISLMNQNFRSLHLYASITALTAGILMVAMITIMSIYPESIILRFEQVIPVDAYIDLLKVAEAPLRAIATIDHIFLIFALLTFLLIGSIIKNEENKLLIYASFIPIFITCYLDIFENHHIIMMLNSVVQNIPITQSDIQMQSIVSLIKFHGGNLNFLLLAFFLPQKSLLEKIFRYALLFLLLPFSIIRYSYPAMPISVVPYIPIAIGFLITSYIFYRRYKLNQLFR